MNYVQNLNGEVHIEDTQAKAGETTGRMRWVLGIGLVLAIGLLTIIWVTGALSQGDVEEEATMTGETMSRMDDGNNTDSIIMQTGDDIEGAPEASD